MKRFKISFEYTDIISNGHWNKQSCLLYANDLFSAKKKCVELYGLGRDCEYRFTNVEEF